MKLRILFFVFALSMFFTSTNCSKEEGVKNVTIGTGGQTGVYFRTGNYIANLVNKKYQVYKINVSFESSAGSVYNINAVIVGDLEFGIAQSDRQYQAYNGTAEWKTRGPQKKLRSVFSIHPESVTLVVNDKSGIKSVNDLKGKRVNLGNRGSGQLQNSKDTLEAFGLTEDDVTAEYVKAVEAPGYLRDERIDAFFYTVGHPTASILDASAGRIEVRIIDIVGEGREKLLKKHSYYLKSVIAKKLYPKIVNEKDIQTFGVKATLVTSVDVDESIVYAVTKEVFENLTEFKKLHPSYESLTKKNMLENLSAPIHKGALKYYKEAGIDKFIDPGLIE